MVNDPITIKSQSLPKTHVHVLAVFLLGSTEKFCKVSVLSFFFSKAPLEETIGELRRELEQCLVSNKSKREQVHKLETELGTVRDQLKDQEIKAQRMERIAQEHEVEIKYCLMNVFNEFMTILQALYIRLC